MTKNKYPKTLTLGDETYTVRLSRPDDAPLIQAFALKLPQQDLLYLNRDITKMPVIEAWLKMAEPGDLETLIVEKDGEVLATSALMVDRLSWSNHVGEIRVLVAEELRKKGLGRSLIEQTFILALDKSLLKVTAQMTLDQKGAIAVFEELGFAGEALLKDHVRDLEGELHDLLIMSCDVQAATTALSLTA